MLKNNYDSGDFHKGLKMHCWGLGRLFSRRMLACKDGGGGVWWGCGSLGDRGQRITADSRPVRAE